MGKHDLPENPVAIPRPFVWPALPQITAVDLAVAERMPASPTHFSFGTEDHRGTITFPAALEPKNAARHFVVTLGTLRFSVWTHPDVVATLATSQGFEGYDDTSVEPTTAALTAEFLLTPFWEVLEAAFDGPLEITSAKIIDDVPPNAALPFALEIGGIGMADLWISADAATHAAILERVFPAPETTKNPLPETLTAKAQLFGPSIEIDKPTFQTLATGDALMIPLPAGTSLAAQVTIGGTLTATVEATSKGLTLATAPTEGFHPMNQHAPTAADEMPVVLSIELAQTRIPLKDLQTLAPGSILPFDTDLPKTVRLMAGDALFAEAELVQLEQNLAVRLIKLG